MKSIPSEGKLRGGYYSPSIIAQFLCDWAIHSKSLKVLETSCGDGIFVEHACKRFLSLGVPAKELSKKVQGIEIVATEAIKAVDRLKLMSVPNAQAMIHNCDFFKYIKKNCKLSQDGIADVVVGNPPFIRYQNFPTEQREIAFSILKSAGLHPNKLTNTWLPFLVISSLILNKNGRLAMVIPAELFQVKYAEETRQFLSQHFRRITIFTFRELVFPEIQQEIVLLLCEKNHVHDSGIRTIELNNAEDLRSVNLKTISRIELKPIDHSKDKWTQYFLDSTEIELLRRLKKESLVFPLSKYIDVDVGVVTGCNDFFILNQSEYLKRRLNGSSLPIVCRSSHLKGLFFLKNDFETNRQSDLPSFLFFPKAHNKRLASCDLRYISYGEEEGFQKGYKCSIRDPWYIVPTVWIPDAFALRQIHEFPKLILNSSGATSTDTIHRIKFKTEHKSINIVTSFINSMTFAFSEVLGRSYGGGVMTFEPSEIEELPVFIPNKNNLEPTKIDMLLREKNIITALDYVDNEVLIKGLKMPIETVHVLRNIWEKLKMRRLGRK